MAAQATVADIATAVGALRSGFVGIDGLGGSGKTTLATLVSAAAPHAVVVHIDDFASPSVPEWDFARFRTQVLLPLLDGRPARYQRWEWASDTGAEWHEIAPSSLVIVEGVSSTRREVAAPWSVTVWVDTPLDVRLARARERDGEQLLATWHDVWLPEENAYVARENPVTRVDFVVSGTDLNPH